MLDGRGRKVLAMKRAILLSIAAATLTSTAAWADPSPVLSAPAPEADHVPVSVGFLYPLATNANLTDVVSNADLSVVYGRVGTIEGLQLGGVAVHAEKEIRGAQVGGVIAITGAVSGAQVAPINVAGPVDGAQLGVVNVGRKVRGLQIGVVNISEEADAAIGVVSIARDGIHPIAWTSSLQYMNAGVKFSTKYMFTAFAVSYGTLEEGLDNVGATAAIGGRIPLPARFDLELQGSYTHLASRQSRDGNQWTAHHAIAGYSFAKHLRLFAGGA